MHVDVARAAFLYMHANRPLAAQFQQRRSRDAPLQRDQRQGGKPAWPPGIKANEETAEECHVQCESTRRVPQTLPRRGVAMEPLVATGLPWI